MTSQKQFKANSKLIFLLIFAFFFIFPAFRSLEVYNAGSEGVATTDYNITSFDVNMELGKNNILKVEEDIAVMHNVQMQGIIRAIPTFQTVIFQDENAKAKKLNYQTKVKLIETNTTYKLIEEKGFLFIRLGDEGVFVSGSKTYTIEYEINLGDDRIKEFDQFYYNIIGNDWDTTISNISFSLSLPSQLEEGKELNLYIGKHGSTIEQSIVVENDLTTFNYTHLGTLNAFEGLTARIVLEQGYFEIAKVINVFDFIILAVLVFAIIFLSIKIFTNKKPIITPIVMFEAPFNLPPSELGYLLSGKVESKDISSLIVYWAQKGYMTITEDKRNYTLTKVKDLDENAQEYEKDIFNKIFEQAEQIKLNDVGEKIWREVAGAKIKIAQKHEKKHFDKKNIWLKKLLFFLSGIAITLVATRNAIANVQPLARVAIALLGLFGLFIMIILSQKQKTMFKKSVNFDKNYLKIFLPICATIFVAMALISLNKTFLGISVTILAVLSACLLLVYAYQLQYRKSENITALGEILGFKQFIALTEKDRIEMLAKENPEMFYNILPYAHVLGVSKVWMDKFEGIALAQPSWLISEGNVGVFDYLFMRAVVDTLFVSAVSQTSYSSQFSSSNTSGSSGGGFGSGGGFSGGGFGGGGGRGW